jgi:hypothetical protein
MYPAFSVAELGEMLPYGCDTCKFVPEEGGWIVHSEDVPGMNWKEDTEADARARCLIYLVENKLISPSAT